MTRTHEAVIAEADRLDEMADELDEETSEGLAQFNRAMERF